MTHTHNAIVARLKYWNALKNTGNKQEINAQ